MAQQVAALIAEHSDVGAGDLAALSAENDQLKKSLFNLNKLYTEKFEIVKHNQEVLKGKQEQEELVRELRWKLADQETRNNNILGVTVVQLHLRLRQSQLQCQLAREQLAEIRDQEDEAKREAEQNLHELKNTQHLLAESEALVQRRDKELLEKTQEYQRMRISWRWQVAALNGKLTKLKDEVLEAKQKQMHTEMMLEEAKSAIESAEHKLQLSAELSAEKEALLEEARREAAAKLDSEYALGEMDYLDQYKAADAVSGTTHLDLHSWGLPSALASGSAGIARLREMMFQQHKSFGVGLESDDIRRVLQTVRKICVDRAMIDLQPHPSGMEMLNLPEFIYAWFGSTAVSHGPTAGPRLHNTGELECSRFVYDLCRLAPKHRELALFHDLLDCAELDEMSYFLHARRVLVGTEISGKQYQEVPMAVAQAACARLIMQHADDQHAKDMRRNATKMLLSSREVRTAAGNADAVALLEGLLGVYREEKSAAKALLKDLHLAASHMDAHPEVHRLRALLQALAPNISDYDVVRIYLQASIQVAKPPKQNSDARAPLRTREVPFDALWLVLQRSGFLVKRQRLAAAFQAQASHEAALARLVPSVLALWMRLRERFRSLLQTAAASPLEADRVWAAQARELFEGVQECVASQRGAAMALYRLRRLLAAVCLWQCLCIERAPNPPSSAEAVTAELEQLAAAIMPREGEAGPGLKRGSGKLEVEGAGSGETFRVTKDPLRRPFTPNTPNKHPPSTRPYSAVK